MRISRLAIRAPMKGTTMGCINTDLDRLIAEDDSDEPFVLGTDPLREKRGRKVDLESREVNIALWHICRGKYDVGGVTRALSMLTGLSEESIRGRVADTEYGYRPEPIPKGSGLTSDDMKYLGRNYGRIKDPAVREFLQGLNGTQRRDPDHEDARVKRQRVTRADGTTKLISLAIDPSKN